MQLTKYFLLAFVLTSLTACHSARDEVDFSIKINQLKQALAQCPKNQITRCINPIKAQLAVLGGVQ